MSSNMVTLFMPENGNKVLSYCRKTTHHSTLFENILKLIVYAS